MAGFVAPAAPDRRHRPTHRSALPVSLGRHRLRQCRPCHALLCTADRTVVFFDVMDTIVRDPFFRGMHRHFGFNSFDDFIAAKHPHTWVEWESGAVDESQLAQRFFRQASELPPRLAPLCRFDGDAFRQYLLQQYAFVDAGMEALLAELHRQPHLELHLFSNYPPYYRLIEQRLQLSRYLRWTAISCETGLRKPALEAYWDAARRAHCPLDGCILIDDRQCNVDAALQAGFRDAIHFGGGSGDLRRALHEHGLLK
ncbi:hypothetical protein CDCA_CDCA09G2620 [Cyanidium caldarium]|uniref:HAD family phosphatase n=1 Tax=Cyanidium caldarium TaxID=2771 RepID=A0AAV9IWX6_CYACA|nr:hypothetical protein CDCA_CDCA09G2620 [Cyanidium caldarium]